jgi:hypothetical protein
MTPNTATNAAILGSFSLLLRFIASTSLFVNRFSSSQCLVPAGPPGIHERSIFVSRILLREVAGVDQMKFAVRQSLVEKFGVDGRDDFCPFGPQ